MSTTSIGVDHVRRLVKIALAFQLHAPHLGPLICSLQNLNIFSSKAK